MSQVTLDTPAPDFALLRFDGQGVFRLSEYTGKAHVLLVLNRGFL